MRAVELRVVFEGNDGKEWVKTITGEDADALWKIASAVSELVDERQDRMDKDFPDARTIGPVLRKTTEYTGHLHAHFTNTMMPPGADEPDENGMVGSFDENVDRGEHAQTGVLDDSAELAIDRRVLPFRLLRYDESPHEPGDDKIVGTYAGPNYRVRIDVTAVRVPEVKP